MSDNNEAFKLIQQELEEKIGSSEVLHEDTFIRVLSDGKNNGTFLVEVKQNQNFIIYDLTLNSIHFNKVDTSNG